MQGWSDVVHATVIAVLVENRKTAMIAFVILVCTARTKTDEVPRMCWCSTNADHRRKQKHNTRSTYAPQR